MRSSLALDMPICSGVAVSSRWSSRAYEGGDAVITTSIAASAVIAVSNVLPSHDVSPEIVVIEDRIRPIPPPSYPRPRDHDSTAAVALKSLAYVDARPSDVRFTPKADIEPRSIHCPLGSKADIAAPFIRSPRRARDSNSGNANCCCLVIERLMRGGLPFLDFVVFG